MSLRLSTNVAASVKIFLRPDKLVCPLSNVFCIYSLPHSYSLVTCHYAVLQWPVVHNLALGYRDTE